MGEDTAAIFQVMIARQFGLGLSFEFIGGKPVIFFVIGFFMFSIEIKRKTESTPWFVFSNLL